MYVVGQFILLGVVAAFRTSRLELANRESLPDVREAERTVALNLVLFCVLLPLTCFGLVAGGVALVTLGDVPESGMPPIPFALLWIGLSEWLLRRYCLRTPYRWERLPTVPVLSLIGWAVLRLSGRAAFASGLLLLVGIGLVRPCGSRQKAYFRAMRSDVEAVSVLQRARVERGLPFASTIAELGVEPSAGVTLTLVETPDGWSALANHFALGTSEYCSTSNQASLDKRWLLWRSNDAHCTR